MIPSFTAQWELRRLVSLRFDLLHLGLMYLLSCIWFKTTTCPFLVRTFRTLTAHSFGMSAPSGYLGTSQYLRL